MIVALIVLALMSVFAISAFNSSGANLRIVGNMQARQEGITAAQDVIETTLSSADFTIDPASVAASAVELDIDGSGTPNYSVRISPMPECFRALPVKSIELDPASAPDRSCMVSSVLQNAGLDFANADASGNSLCSNSEWNIRAVASDVRSAVRVALNQGVAVRILETDAANACGL